MIYKYMVNMYVNMYVNMKPEFFNRKYMFIA